MLAARDVRERTNLKMSNDYEPHAPHNSQEELKRQSEGVADVWELCKAVSLAVSTECGGATNRLACKGDMIDLGRIDAFDEYNRRDRDQAEQISRRWHVPLIASPPLPRSEWITGDRQDVTYL